MMQSQYLYVFASLLFYTSHACYTTCYHCKTRVLKMSNPRDDYVIACMESVDGMPTKKCSFPCLVTAEYFVNKSMLWQPGSVKIVYNVSITRECALSEPNVWNVCRRLKKVVNGPVDSIHVKCALKCEQNNCNGKTLENMINRSIMRRETHSTCSYCLPKKENPFECSSRRMNKNGLGTEVLCDYGLCYIKTVIKTTPTYERGCLPNRLKGEKWIYAHYPGIMNTMNTIGVPYKVDNDIAIYYNLCNPEEIFGPARFSIVQKPCNQHVLEYNYNSALNQRDIEKKYPNRIDAHICLYCYEEMTERSIRTNRSGNCHKAKIISRNFDEIICKEHCATYIYFSHDRIKIARGCDYAKDLPMANPKYSVDSFMDKIPEVLKEKDLPCTLNQGGYCTYKCKGKDHCNTATIRFEDITMAPRLFDEEKYINELHRQSETTLPEESTIAQENTTIEVTEVPVVANDVITLPRVTKPQVIDEYDSNYDDDYKDDDDGNYNTILLVVIAILVIAILAYLACSFALPFDGYAHTEAVMQVCDMNEQAFTNNSAVGVSVHDDSDGQAAQSVASADPMGVYRNMRKPSDATSAKNVMVKSNTRRCSSGRGMVA